MEFDETGKYGPSWAKAVSDLLASDDAEKALASAKECGGLGIFGGILWARCKLIELVFDHFC